METPAVRPAYRIFDGGMLKMIALVTMFADHIGAAVLEAGILAGFSSGTLAISGGTAEFFRCADAVLRAVGRIAFPVYAFLLAEGFWHTGSVRRYAARLLVFGLISEVPFDLAFYRAWVYAGHQNVYFTLFLGLAALEGLRRFEKSRWKQAAAVLICAGAAWLLRTDYGAYGVFLIVFWSLVRGLPQLSRLVLGAVVTGAHSPMAALAAFPIAMYNGKRGRQWKKSFFYWFYPVHMLALCLVRACWMSLL